MGNDNEDDKFLEQVSVENPTQSSPEIVNSELHLKSNIVNNEKNVLPFLDEIRSFSLTPRHHEHDIESQYQIVHVPTNETSPVLIPEDESNFTEPIDCSICLLQTTYNFKLACEHSFCQPCLKSYVSMNIKDRRVSPRIMICPNVDCKRTILHQEVEKLCPTQINEYKSALVEINKRILICPNENCRDYIELNSLRQRKAECSTCNVTYCLRCERTRGLSCKLGLCRNSSTSEVKSWGFGKPLKRCPECQYFIEKNGGCNHMTCSRCGYQFRWCCMAAYNHSHNELLCPFLRVFHSTSAWFGPHALIRFLTKTATVVLGVSAAVTVVCLGIGVGAIVLPIWLTKEGISKLIKWFKRKQFLSFSRPNRRTENV